MRVVMVQLGPETPFLPLGNRKMKGWVSIAWNPFTLFGKTGGRACGSPSVCSGCDSSEEKLASYLVPLKVNSPEHGKAQSSNTPETIGEDQCNDDL